MLLELSSATGLLAVFEHSSQKYFNLYIYLTEKYDWHKIKYIAKSHVIIKYMVHTVELEPRSVFSAVVVFF